MPDDLQAPRKRRTKLWLALAAVIVLLALIFVPPYISLNNYKARVTQSVAAALGRSVRLSDVELRLLPRPGFLLTDLTVQEDPAYGVEPVLHANEVKAAIRFSSLWQGKLQISRISVDEASLNLVHMPDGAWNFDPLFRNAAVGSTKGDAQQPPYLEATHSRINIKDGLEKLPFSLLDADASLWRESNGNWRVRLKGQPARTDVTLDLADTGIVRMDATLHPGPQLYQMPLHIDIDWREAQLGQLTRLVLSSDEGWRGALTGELHLDGTAGSAKVQARLRASGVHRAEFAPAAPMDFDATCAFNLRYSSRTVDDLLCNSPVGDGRARITGSVPGDGKQPRVTLELDRVPAQVALDLLRTMRNSIDPSLQAAGSISGHMTYDPASAESAAQVPAPAAPKRSAARAARPPQPHAPPSPFSGAFTVTGLRVQGEALSRPIQVATMTLEPSPEQPGQPAALFTSLTVPAGGATPLAVTARIGLRNFELGVHGTAALSRLREFAHVTGSDAEPALAELAGDPATLDFTAQGPWVPPPDTRLALSPTFGPVPPARSIQTHGTVTLKNANWKASFLANAMMIPAATLHLDNGNLRWDPVEFEYGPVKGTATLEIPDTCSKTDATPAAVPDAASEICPAGFTLHFADLDAAALQAALLGAREKGTLLSSLLDRIKPNSTPAWPQLEGTATADTLLLGPFTLSKVTAAVKILPSGADVSSFQAALFGGTLSGNAALVTGDKPDYKIDASFNAINPAPLGQLAELKFSGGTISGTGKLELIGYTDEDLGKSAKGAVHFDWTNGAVSGAGVPPALARFARWTADATIADGGMKLEPGQIQTAQAQHGARNTQVAATVTFATPARVSFSPAEPLERVKAARR
jgi:hypothetical protein